MFLQAKPIWIFGKECEMNVHAVFRTRILLKPNTKLHITGFTFYRIYMNDKFVGVGPARAAHGYAREDVFDLNQYNIAEGQVCEIIIEMVGYYCRSLSTVFQPSFLMAEVQSEGDVLAYTGQDFEGFLPECKVQKVERYSVQRHFCEVWDYRKVKSFTDECYKADIEELSLDLIVLDRKVPQPLHEDIELNSIKRYGTFEYDETLSHKKLRYSWETVPECWGRYEWDEIPHHAYSWMQCLKQDAKGGEKELPISLKAGEYVVLDFGRIEAGFITASMKALEESDVVIGFSEFYLGDDFSFTNMDAHNVVEYFLDAGDDRNLQSFEPYTFRFAMVAVNKGDIQLTSFGAKTYMYDISKVKLLSSSDETLNAIYRAAVRTFAHNTVDLYFDCPSRERAGWLCDSYFTAKTEHVLTGETRVEDAFLENYRLFDNFDGYPEGVIPMCYPSDINYQPVIEPEYIPQWTMWYILEVEEYIHKRGHQDLVEAFRDSIYGLLDFYRRYENEDGLLERLPSWNFVEWSDANSWTKDVNYPTNFLYAQVLERIASLYGDEECLRRSEEVRKVAVEQSFNGHYFMDHAIRDKEGKLQLQEHSSEACQYYAVLFAGIDIYSEEYKELKDLILYVFTPDRNGVMPEILEVNAFIGAYLRLETLLKMREAELLLHDVKGFFGKMEQYTGTLWEYRQFEGSYDHGFASYALVVIEDALIMKEGL